MIITQGFDSTHGLIILGYIASTPLDIGIDINSVTSTSVSLSAVGDAELFFWYKFERGREFKLISKSRTFVDNDCKPEKNYRYLCIMVKNGQFHQVNQYITTDNYAGPVVTVVEGVEKPPSVRGVFYNGATGTYRRN